MTRAPISRVLVGPDPPLTGGTLTVLEDDGDLFPTPPFGYLAWPAQKLPAVGNSERGVVTGIQGDDFTLTRGTPPVDLDGLMFAALDIIELYELGTPVHLEVTFPEGGSVTGVLTIVDPEGSLSSYEGTASGIMVEGDGVFSFELVPQVGGLWRADWLSPTLVPVDERDFFVRFGLT